MSDFGGGAWRKARKQHKCDYCSGPIPIGETYYRYVGMFENEFQNWAMHHECWSDWDISGDPEFGPGDMPMPDRVKSLLTTVEPA